MTRNDILLRDDDLAINAAGDFELGISDPQHVYHILLNAKGSYKQFPLTGIGKAKYINAPLGAELRREIQLQLEADRYRVTELKLSEREGIQLKFDPI